MTVHWRGNTIRRLLSSALIGVALAFSGSSLEAAGNTITVVVNHAPPYRIVDENTPKDSNGIYIDIAKTLFARAGYDLDFKVVPFSRALYLMEAGEGDVMLGPNRTAERERFMLYLDAPLPSEPKAFYTLKEAPAIASYDDLTGRKIAVLRDAKYFPAFDEDESLSKVAVTDYGQALKMAQLGRVDVVIMPEMLGDYLLREGPAGLHKNAFRAAGRLSYIAVSKKSTLQDEAGRLTALLQAMKDDGSFETVLERYR